MELIMAVLIFAVVSSAAVAFFVKAATLSSDASKLTQSSSRAEDICELFRSSYSLQEFSGLIAQEFPGAAIKDGTEYSSIEIFYSSSFEQISESERDKAAIVFSIKSVNEDGMMKARITARNIITDKKIYSVECSHYTG